MTKMNNKSGFQPYEKPAIIYTGLFEEPMGSPITPPTGLEPEFRAERDGGQNWLRSFVDLLRVR